MPSTEQRVGRVPASIAPPGRSSVIIALVALSAALVVGSGLQGSADSEPALYHILVTNDDGIESPGIQVLARELESVGEVVVVAPCGERSGSSMAVSLGAEVRLRPFEQDGRMIGHCADTTPAGTALLGLTALAPSGGFDLVVSGINRGANVGDVSHMSGTVGAAMMGAFHGVPAVAASLGERGDFGYAARFVTRFVGELKERRPDPGVVYSINVPKASESDTRGVAVTPMGGSYLKVEYEEVPGSGGERVFRPRFGSPDPYPEGSDSEAYGRDLITITPLRFDWTARDVLDGLEGWGLDLLVNDRP